MSEKVHAPFTPDQVASLNAYQLAGVMHPFTCGGSDCHGIRLIAAADGWHCARQSCGYRQTWAHAVMADWSWRMLGLDSRRGVEPDLGAAFEAHAAESLALANEAFDAVAESWPDCAEEVNAALEPETIEALRKELASGNPARFRKTRDPGVKTWPKG